jgi:hypothetical protein
LVMFVLREFDRKNIRTYGLGGAAPACKPALRF